MTIEFLSDNENYHQDSFEMLLKTIQSNFGFFTAVLTKYFDDFMDTIPQINTFIDTSSIDSTSHSLVRCYSTRCILDALFDMSKWYTYAGFKPDDMKFTIIEIGGRLFPDHTFVLIEFRESYFLLQSYYFAYLLSGKYGILQLDLESMTDIHEIFIAYQNLSRRDFESEADYEYLAQTNQRLSKFTGVDSEKHIGNMKWRGDRGDNFITQNITCANSQCVFRAFEKRITLFEDTLFSKIGHPADIITIPFRYFFSDAFIPEALDPMFVDIQSLNPDQKKQAFQKLVGTEYPAGNIMGIEVGPYVEEIQISEDGRTKQISGFISQKTINIAINSIFKMFIDIKKRIIPLIHNSRYMNLDVAKAYPNVLNLEYLGQRYNIKMSDITVLDEQANNQQTKMIFAPMLSREYPIARDRYIHNFD